MVLDVDGLDVPQAMFDWQAIADELNAHACGQCEHGAVPMTDEAMAEHGWVRERTCRAEEVPMGVHDDETATVCSLCKVAVDDLADCYYCPNCGAKVVD